MDYNRGVGDIKRPKKIGRKLRRRIRVDELDGNLDGRNKPADPGEQDVADAEAVIHRTPKEKDQLHMKCREDQYNVGELKGWSRRLGGFNKSAPSEKIITKAQNYLNDLHGKSEQIYEKYMELMQARGKYGHEQIEADLFYLYKQFLSTSAEMEIWLYEKEGGGEIDEKQRESILITLRRLTTNAEIANALQVKTDLITIKLQAEDAMNTGQKMQSTAEQMITETQDKYKLLEDQLLEQYITAEAQALNDVKASVEEKARLNEELVKKNQQCNLMVQSYAKHTGVDLHKETVAPPPAPSKSRRRWWQRSKTVRGAKRYKKKVNSPIKRKKTFKKKVTEKSNDDSTKRKSTRVPVRRKTIKKKTLKRKSTHDKKLSKNSIR